MSEDWIGRPLDLLLGYQPEMVMPTIRDSDDTPWHPEDSVVSACQAITKRTATEDAYQFWRRKHRIGLRWREMNRAGLRRAADDTRMLRARQTVRRLLETGRLVMPDNMNDTDAQRAEEALAYAVSVIQDSSQDTKNRLSAAKTLLDFTKQRPATKGEVTVKSAMDWLDEVAE